MSVINTNYLALVSQNNLTKSQGALGSAIERLSSGLRINSAKDDAAGQAIANRFTSNVRGLTQAARNANDGISIAQTTEGALNEINNNIQRIRELAVQAANGSNSSKDLESIQNEIGERLEEIDRISEQTDFNGVKVLGGEEKSVNHLTVQVGAQDGETISIKLDVINTEELGIEGFSVAVKPQDQVIAVTAVDKAADAAAPTFTLDGNAVDAADVTIHKADDTDSYYAEIDGTIYNVDIAGSNLNGDGDLTGAIVIGSEVAGAALNGSDIEITADPDAPIAFPHADKLLEQIDGARDTVDALRSHLGAIQNRFESTVANLNNTITNLSAARSRIEDADYAVEVSNMTRAQILQQAGTSVLAQANQVPQGVLSLLR